MVTEARKRANAKWDKENMTIIGCKVKKDYAARFRAACVAAGTTPNAVLKMHLRKNKGTCLMATIIGCLLFGFWFFQALFKASK